MNSDGTKLSKRNTTGNNMVHVEQFKDNGYYADSLINFLTLTGGGFRDKDFTEDRIHSLKELSDRFDYHLLKTNSSKVEFERLENLNRNSLLEKLSTATNTTKSSQHKCNVNISRQGILAEAKV